MLDRVTHRAARSCSAKGAASGAVDNPTSARHHLRINRFCPNKRGHLCNRYWQGQAIAVRGDWLKSGMTQRQSTVAK